MGWWSKKVRDLTGITAKEQELAAEEARIAEEEMKLLKKKDPKEYATRRKESWVNVIDVKVNKENVRNGFFELDWNEYFIKELIQTGYGVENDPEEEIVDRWFRDIVYQMLDEEGLDTQRGSGYINVVPISKGKSEIS
jgi:hypothetical protein